MTDSNVCRLSIPLHCNCASCVSVPLHSEVCKAGETVKNTSNAYRQKMSKQKRQIFKPLAEFFIMTPLNLHTLNSSLLALPVAMIVTKKLLLNHNPLTAVASSSTKKAINSIQRRAHTMTATLKNIVGYDHSGLNE